jgi:hypothetical protein
MSRADRRRAEAEPADGTHQVVSGILFPTEETFASCQLCPREDCPNRRAPYDAELFERKYKASTAVPSSQPGRYPVINRQGAISMTLAERKAKWAQKMVAKVLAKAPERCARFETSSGIPVERVYTPDQDAGACPPSTPHTRKSWDCPASIRTRAGCSPPCIAAGSGPCASTPGSAPRRRATSAIVTSSRRADRPQRRVRPAHPDRLRRG